MKNSLFLLLICLSLAARAQGTYTISGTVSDEKQMMLPGAMVFIANTKMATSTNSSGKFILSGLQAGTYEVTVKMLGFVAYIKAVVVQNSSVELPVVLKENNIMLNTVNITSRSSADRALYLKIFIENLLGRSANATECKLLNPDVVNVWHNLDKFLYEASADDFLIIEDKALGYKIHYLLADFRLYAGGRLFYDGSLFFEELPGSKAQQKRWENNRKLTYEGSRRHFFKAAFANTLKEEGFLVYRFPDANAIKRHTKDNTNIDGKYYTPFDKTNSLFTTVDENNKLFNLGILKKDTTELYIIYTRKNEPEEFIRLGNEIRLPFRIALPEKQMTIMHPVLDSLVVDQYGNINPISGMAQMGYWTWSGTADFLPPDYNPDNIPAATLPKKRDDEKKKQR